MKDQRKILKFLEIFLILFVWLVLLITPILFREDDNKPVWESLLKQLVTILPLTLIILLNRYVLVPKLFLKGRHLTFLLTMFGLIGFLTIGIYLFDFKDKQPQDRMDQEAESLKMPVRDDFSNGEDDEVAKPRNQQGRQGPIPSFANFLMLSVLIAGFDTGLHASVEWTKAEREKARLEKENITNKLLLLRSQVNPHFLMNTLNNIHSMVDINASEAKSSIIRLSKMMRYLLYDSETMNTTLKKEIEFIENYIGLMRLRISEKVSIETFFPSNLPEKKIAPSLFISIVENIFKQEISYKDKHKIRLELIVGNDRLIFVAQNSKTERSRLEDYRGIGIQNLLNRLELLYGNNYHLEIIESEDLYTLNLSIPV